VSLTNREQFAPPPPGAHRRWNWWHYAIAAAVGALIFYGTAIVFPRVFLFTSYGGLKQFFYEQLGVQSDASATLFARIVSFVWAVTWGPFLLRTSRVLLGRFSLRRAIAAFIPFMVLYGLLPFLSAIYGTNVCFNQRTGQPIKWYVVMPGGQIVLRDSPGFDKNGKERRPATIQVCRALEAQRRGVRPHPITDDPRKVTFFDGVTGLPRVWYYRTAQGRIDLFDNEGTDPANGEVLQPVTRQVVEEVRSQAAAKEAEAQRVARLAAERKQAEAKEKARKDLIELFGVASYADGVVIVGATARQKDEASTQAADQMLSALVKALRAKGLDVDVFRPEVYSSRQFSSLANGDATVLLDVGLAQKMRAAVVAVVDASCRRSSELSGIVSCAVSAQVRLISPTGNGSLRQWSETGAGETQAQAVARAAQLMAERHPNLLDGV
jgi:hypothetical protein